MTKKNCFYLTTTLPYVNAEPHIGFSYEIIRADTIARYRRLLGEEVFFNFGTDEHGLKIYEKAKEEGKNPQEYVNENAKNFDALKNALNVSYNNFIRTTDPDHVKATQEFWKICDKNGDIYKKKYKAKYCVGCELEKKDSELKNGKCELHPTRTIKTVDEENYFFRFSRYEKKLLELYEKNPDFVVPNFRFNEIKRFVKTGLQDFSVSRLQSKLPWGVPVPGDSDHVMYVWFDALINYISAIGWPADLPKFKKWWPVVQFAGKDNLRQQSAIWQAMLMSADLPNSKQIVIHGFLTLDGKKISKSTGNTINPINFVEKYGTDALRYYLLAKVNPFEDSDFSVKKFEEVYNADLANGLGNLVSRVAKLCELSGLEFSEAKNEIYGEVGKYLEKYRFDKAVGYIWSEIAKIDKLVDKNELWKATNKKQDVLEKCVVGIREIAYNLRPFLPKTAERIEKQFGGKIIKSEDGLFPRLKE